MAVIRVNKKTDYTVMSNTHFKEKDMSLKAKGLLSLMLSLPDNWDYSISGLVELSKDGKDSVMNAMSELATFKYLKQTRVVNEKGQFAGYDYDIYEKPYTEKPQGEKPYAENPNTENPNTGKPNTENPPQLNTNKSNTKELNTKQEKKERKKSSFDEIIAAYAMKIESPVCDEVLDLLKEWLKVRKAKRAAMTDRAVQMNIDKLDMLAKKSNMSVVEYLKEVVRRGWAAFYEIKPLFTANSNNHSIYCVDEDEDTLDDLF